MTWNLTPPTPAPWPVLVRHIDGSETMGITWRYAERGRTITCPDCTTCGRKREYP